MLPRANRRGVTLLEGMISGVILVIGMVGVLQGILVSATQNSMASRQTRASIVANELLSAVEQQGRARLFATGGLFNGCSPLPLPTALQRYAGALDPMPANLIGFTGCYVNFDSAGASFQLMTPGYTASDRALFERVLIIYRNTSNDEVAYVGLNVGWRDGGRDRIVQRFTSLYNTTLNQTNLEY